MKKGRHAKRRIKGSSVVITAMYVLWIWYICAQVWTFANYSAWLPSEVTYGTAACFIVETIALARIKLSKEGYVLPNKKPNQFLQRIGIVDGSELEEITQEISKENEKENNHDGETD
ncbi:MAG: hypothetical protein Q4C41_03500 [Eggerthellaceae bacterium]|nr:hypothetical protein [Eggerthellaceae bacterium]